MHFCPLLSFLSSLLFSPPPLLPSPSPLLPPLCSFDNHKGYCYCIFRPAVGDKRLSWTPSASQMWYQRVIDCFCLPRPLIWAIAYFFLNILFFFFFVSAQGRNSASVISPAPLEWSSHRGFRINTPTIWSVPTWSLHRLAWTSPSPSLPSTWRMTPYWWEKETASTTGWTFGTVCHKVSVHT